MRKLAILFLFIPIVAVVCFIYARYEHLYETGSNYPHYVAIKGLADRPGSTVLRVARPKQSLGLAPHKFSPCGQGMDREFLEEFTSKHSFKIKWINTQSCDEALDLLAKKRCDLVVGYGGELSEAQKSTLAQGPVYAYFNPIMQDIAESFKNKKILLQAEESIGRFSYSYHQDRKSKDKNTAENNEKESRPQSISTPLFLLDPAIYKVIVPSALAVHGDAVGFRWFWQAKNYNTAKLLNEFWQNHEMRQLVGEMQAAYSTAIPKKPKDVDIPYITKIVATRLHRYSDQILQASYRYKIDPLLLSALIFQESRFDPNATSYTGVKGIMQLTTDTAAMLKVNRMDPGQAIRGGARYLRQIYDSLDGMDIGEWDRWYFALAGYNQGPTVLRRALRQTEKMGQPLSWVNVRTLYPKLKQYGLAGDGFRGGEAVHYVENVRYYYSVMLGLATLSSPEYKHLTSLFSAGQGR